MLTAEEIKNIIKSKYGDVKSINNTKGEGFSFNEKVTDPGETEHIYYTDALLIYEVELKVTIPKTIADNNVVSLKHLLCIEKTEEDITNWLLSIGFEKEDDYYFKSINNRRLVYQNKKLYQSYTFTESYGAPIFEVKDSDDYWGLYMFINYIINNSIKR